MLVGRSTFDREVTGSNDRAGNLTLCEPHQAMSLKDRASVITYTLLSLALISGLVELVAIYLPPR